MCIWPYCCLTLTKSLKVAPCYGEIAEQGIVPSERWHSPGWGIGKQTPGPSVLGGNTWHRDGGCIWYVGPPVLCMPLELRLIPNIVST